MKIRCDMLATVWKVGVAVGQEVRAGEELLVLESMKMEIPVVAPSAGTVTVLHVSEGQPVDDGDDLVELEPVATT